MVFVDFTVLQFDTFPFMFTIKQLSLPIQYGRFVNAPLTLPFLGGYNRTSRLAAQQAKIYLARPLPAAVLCLDGLPV